jgi:hypothetical protein
MSSAKDYGMVNTSVSCRPTMARNIHDRFSKEWLKQLLPDFGTVEIESQIMGEIRTIDVVFYPNSKGLNLLPELGLLGKILAKPCAIEAFRNPVPLWEISNCCNKRFVLENELIRLAKREKRGLSRKACPALWIITPTFSVTLRRNCKAEAHPTWEGIYLLPNRDRTGIIAIHELPKTEDTILLRLLGKGSVQAQAIKELTALPPDHPYLQETLEHISSLQISLKLRQNKTKDIKEVIMNLSPAYEKWKEETLAEGEARGEARGEVRGSRKALVSVARTMLREGVAIAFIAKITGFSIAEIEQLVLEKEE